MYTAGGLVIDFDPCAVGTLALTRGKIAKQGVHLPLVEKLTTFTSDDVKLHGKLVLPPDSRAEFAAVWIEGSNNDPSTDDAVWQYELARRGVITSLAGRTREPKPLAGEVRTGGSTIRLGTGC